MRRPLAIALGMSALAHTVMFAGLVGVPLVRMATNLPIELVAMKKHAPSVPIAGPSPGGKPEPDRPPPKPVTHAPRPAKPKPAPAPPAPDLHQVGPSSSNLTLVLRTASLRTSVHREGTEALLALLPDYHTLLDGTGLSLFDDLSALMIATPDPRDVAVTFLAARHRVDPRFDRILGKVLGRGDPRKFRALGPDLTLLGPPGVLAQLDGLGDDGQLSESRRWIGALRRFDVGPQSTALELTISNLPELVRFAGAVPLPHAINLSATADASPVVHLVCTFDDAATAQRFYAFWPQVQARVGEAGPMFSGALDDVKPHLADKTVELAGTLPERQVALALSLVRLFTQRPPDSEPTDLQ